MRRWLISRINAIENREIAAIRVWPNKINEGRKRGLNGKESFPAKI